MSRITMRVHQRPTANGLEWYRNNIARWIELFFVTGSLIGVKFREKWSRALLTGLRRGRVEQHPLEVSLNNLYDVVTMRLPTSSSILATSWKLNSSGTSALFSPCVKVRACECQRGLDGKKKRSPWFFSSWAQRKHLLHLESMFWDCWTVSRWMTGRKEIILVFSDGFQHLREDESWHQIF